MSSTTCRRRGDVFHRRYAIGAAALATTLIVSVTPLRASLAPTSRILVVSGDATPNGDGTFGNLNSPPVINHVGQTVFSDFLAVPVESAIFRDDGTSLAQVVRAGDLAPDGDSFIGVDDPSVNDSGQVGFRGFLDGTPFGIGDVRIFREAAGTLTQIVRTGDLAPDGNGRYFAISPPHFNDAGQVAFEANFVNTTGGNGIFRGDETTVVRIVRTGDPAPDGNGAFQGASGSFVLNNVGQVVFPGNLVGSIGGTSDDQGIFLGDGTTITQILREDDPAPDGNGAVTTLFLPSLNDAGQVAIAAALDGTIGGTSDDFGLFLSDGATRSTVFREGDPAPDGNGSISGIAGTIVASLNNVGQTAFAARITTPAGTEQAILRGDSAALTQIVRSGEFAPDGSSIFVSFGTPELNDAGQLAFQGGVDLDASDGLAGDETGIFFFDDTQGLVEIVRTGDALLGSTIRSISFRSSVGTVGDQRSGFNDLGQIAFQVRLFDERRALVIWTPVPEPASLALLALGGLAICFRWRERREGYASGIVL